MPAHFASRFEIALTERWPAAAFPAFHQRDGEAERFENFYRRDSNVRLVVTNERVVPKNYVASGRDAALRRPRFTLDVRICLRPIPRTDVAARRPCHAPIKPAVESFSCVMRK